MKVIKSKKMDTKQLQILSSLIERPTSFTGSGDTGSGLKWLKQIERLKKGLNLTDEEALFVAGSHLKGKAETWWNNNEKDFNSWEKFETSFRISFSPDESAIDLWWNKIISLRQRKEQSVEDLKIQFDELCNLLESADEEIPENHKIRYFRKALKKDILYELDRAPITIRSNWDTMIKEAKRIEMNFKRYDIVDDDEFQKKSINSKRLDIGDNTDNPVPSSSVSNASSELSTVIRQLCNDMKELKITISNNGSVYNSQQSYLPRKDHFKRYNNNSSTNYIKCFTCGEMGHKSVQCTKGIRQSMGNTQNAIVNENLQGKEKGQQ